jgi:hypothetical protein
MPTPDEKPLNFDPTRMQSIAEQMIADGVMLPKAEFLAAMERIREKYAAKILKAREQDQQAASSETTSPLTPQS